MNIFRMKNEYIFITKPLGLQLNYNYCYKVVRERERCFDAYGDISFIFYTKGVRKRSNFCENTDKRQISLRWSE